MVSKLKQIALNIYLISGGLEKSTTEFEYVGTQSKRPCIFLKLNSLLLLTILCYGRSGIELLLPNKFTAHAVNAFLDCEIWYGNEVHAPLLIYSGLEEEIFPKRKK